jgi:Putative phage serine protease XkdF/HNH endonuclease
MAHEFLRKGLVNHIDVQHSRKGSGGYVVESFIARDDDATFIPGSRVLGVKVPDAGVWELVKPGELNCFSLDGMGTPRGRQQLQEVRRPADSRLLGEAQAHGRTQLVRKEERIMAPTPERLRELMDYDPLTGVFTAKVRTGGRVVPGTVLGTNNCGYVRISVDGKLYYGHQLAFLFMTGSIPSEIDHDDRKRGNNRWANLRDVTHLKMQLIAMYGRRTS